MTALRRAPLIIASDAERAADAASSRAPRRHAALLFIAAFDAVSPFCLRRRHA